MPDNPALQRLESTVSEMSKTLSGLCSDMRSQTEILEGFKDLVGLHIETIKKETHTLKNAVGLQDAKVENLKALIIEPLKTEVSELRHLVKGLQTYPKTLHALVKRVQNIEQDNLLSAGRKQGIKSSLHIAWAAVTVAVGLIEWILKGHFN